MIKKIKYKQFYKSIDPIIKDYMKTESIEMLIERKIL